MTDRIVHCRLLKQDLPGLDRPPYRNELGQKIFDEVSKEAWARWVKDSVRFINTYQAWTSSRPRAKSSCCTSARCTSATRRATRRRTAWTAPPAEK